MNEVKIFCQVNFKENRFRKMQFSDTLFKFKLRIMHFFQSLKVAFSPPEIHK